MRIPAHFPLIAIMVSLTIFCISCTPEPGAAFSADRTTVTEGEAVQFTDLSSNAPTSWLWEFSGGTPSLSQLQNPSVIYDNEGTYSVSLEVRNRGGSNLITMSNYITVLPATTDLTFTNSTYTEVLIEINGVEKTVARGEEVTYNKLPLSKIDMSTLFDEFFDIVQRHNIKLKPEFMLFGKAIVTYFLLDETYRKSLGTRSKKEGRFHRTLQNKWIFDQPAYGSSMWYCPKWARVPEAAIGVTETGLADADIR